ncbi:MAG: 4-hydroxy-3-methylbut-2-enyl diphosphate reductase [Deltaproteobacteria bacterium]|nr:MAG: 4-hydroxy-3-methylbut-2-enyl diphosphate reductase [Deltaproteobacteria bacterium]
MKITIAKTAGFCMGVRRAVEMVLDTPSKYNSPIYTFGPLIHNPQVLDLLSEKGITTLTKVPDHGEGTILIRAHGVPPETKAQLSRAGFTVLDATCPRVIRVQVIIRKHTRKGYTTIIVGNRNHPEVVGLLGYAGQNGHVIAGTEELKALPVFDQAIIVAQTTQNQQLYEQITRWTGKHRAHYKIFNTICNSTSRRQIEVKELAHRSDAIVVVGGRESGNTRRLAEIVRETGKPAFQVESETDLNLADFGSLNRVGITAGASTPNWVLRRVFRTLDKESITKGRALHRAFFTLRRALLLTNIYVALGAGSLCFACAELQGFYDHFSTVLVTMLYVFSMHIMNNLIGAKADRFNDPGRAHFYQKYKLPLVLLAIMAGGYGLIIAATMGVLPFTVLLLMSLLGLSYNLPLLPDIFTKGRYRSIRDIPGSKTVLIAIAWGVATAVFPALVHINGISPATVVVFFWSTALVFARTAFFDILDMQGDRIVGRETIPLLFGEQATTRFLKLILTISPLVLIFSAAISLVTSLAVGLTVSPVFLYLVIAFHEKGHMLPGIRLEFLVESGFILAGLITLTWMVFN